ncbi:MAG: HEAT repeat domain-containing protein [bacterium]
MKRLITVLTSLVVMIIITSIPGSVAKVTEGAKLETGILHTIPCLREKSLPAREIVPASEKIISHPVNAVEPLIADLKDQDPQVREDAAEALGKIKNVRAVEPLIAALKDESPKVRENAAEALGRIRDAGAVNSLIVALQDEDRNVREEAAEALGRIGKAGAAVEPLIAALRDEDQEVREEAAEALGKIKDLRAVEPLIAALKDEEPEVKENAARALRKITGEDFGQDPANWEKWLEQEKKSPL